MIFSVVSSLSKSSPLVSSLPVISQPDLSPYPPNVTNPEISMESNTFSLDRVVSLSSSLTSNVPFIVVLPVSLSISNVFIGAVFPESVLGGI